MLEVLWLLFFVWKYGYWFIFIDYCKILKLKIYFNFIVKLYCVLYRGLRVWLLFFLIYVKMDISIYLFEIIWLSFVD